MKIWHGKEYNERGERQLAEYLEYYHIDKGYMLPHAVDDRCTCMGGFWTGTIDHACSAWVAKMMFDYCEYTGDKEYLRNEVYDFMTGVLAVYDAMTEYDAEAQMEALGHNFFVFLNANTGLVSVLYKRNDNNLGMIEITY